MIKLDKTKDYHHQRKKQTTETSRLSKTHFGERNVRPRKRLLADNYLYCEKCQKYSESLCPQGCQTYEANRLATHATHTVPSGLKVTNSSIPKAGLGVFAMKTFLENTFFGPYTGERHRSTERANQSGYAWTIEDAENNVYNYIDASDPRRSNWLRYVNCPNRQEDENLVAVQFNGELYYRASRDIQEGEELFVYYGEEYARALGISPFEYPTDEDQMPIAPSPPPMSTVTLKKGQINTPKKHRESKDTLLHPNSRRS